MKTSYKALLSQTQCPSRTWQSLSVEEITQSLADLIADAKSFDAGCEEVFQMYKKGATNCVTSASAQILSKKLTDRLGCQDQSLLSHLAVVLHNFEACHADERGFNRDELKAYLLTAVALIHDKLQAISPGRESVQPVRLQMRSADKLWARSMEVEWKNGDGDQQRWSSWDDQVQNGWYEAEIVLPSSAIDIKVAFTAHGIKDNAVKKVDRKNGCKWIKDKVTKKCPREEFFLRSSPKTAVDPVDVTFKLKGAAAACYVQKAWNAARNRAPDEWEHWEGKSPRPQAQPRLATLMAADKAAPPECDSDDPLQLVASRQARLNAAASVLVEIRRETINGLRKLDGSITKQWLGVNSANTATAGLAVGSAAAMFVAPPLGIGLGLAAAATGGMTTAADVSEDSCMLKSFRNQLSLDRWNAHAVAELENDWLVAREKAEEALAEEGDSGIGNGSTELCFKGARFVQMGSSVTNVVSQLADGAVATRGAVAAGAATARVAGVFGAVAAVGVAAHGWSTTKFSQKAVRAKLAELTSSLLSMQRWLAGLERLECPICLEALSLVGQTRRCCHSYHYFHAECLQNWCQTCEGRDWAVTCPECRGQVSADEQSLDDFITTDMRTHLAGSSR